jgi:hypothetical protein
LIKRLGGFTPWKAVYIEWPGFLVTDDEWAGMDGFPAVVFALLFCVASVSGVAVQAQTQGQTTMSVIAENDTAEYLAPATVDRSEGETAQLDVAGAVGGNAIEVETTYRRVSFQRAYRNAASDTERRAVIQRASTWYTEQTDYLQQRRRVAIRQYGDGEIRTDELFRTLAAVDRAAGVMEADMQWFESNADSLGMDAVESQLGSDRVRLLTLGGPLGEDLNEALDGGRTLSVHAEVSDNATVLAAIETDENGDVTYIRQADDPSARSIGVADSYDGDLSPALDRIEELYPWVTDNGSPTVDFIGPDAARLYRFEYDHPHGTLRTYLDGGSEHIAQEVQYKDPTTVPTNDIETAEGDLELHINTTRAVGPLGVSVRNRTTGELVDARVRVNGQQVGNTDGARLWTVAPRGGVTVNATHNGRSLTVVTTLE